MPGITGLELARRVRATYPGLHVVLTSGYSELLVRETNHGFVVLRKPYTLGGLAEAIKPPVGAGEVVVELGSDDRVWPTVG